jgi:hypothetical protein
MEGFNLVGEGEVGGSKRGVRGSLRIAFLLVAVLARLLRALWIKATRPGLRVVAWAELAQPR